MGSIIWEDLLHNGHETVEGMMKELYLGQGLSLEAIGKKLGVCPDTVSRKLYKLRIPVRGRGECQNGKALLLYITEQALPLVERLAEYEPKYQGFACEHCGAVSHDAPWHYENCLKLKAQALLPRMQAALKNHRNGGGR